MSKKFLLVLAAVLWQLPGMADAGVRIGIGLGFGFPIGPYPYYPYGYPYPYYAPYAAYPAPVVVQQPPVVMPPATYYQAPSAGPSGAVGTAPPTRRRPWLAPRRLPRRTIPLLHL